MARPTVFIVCPPGVGRSVAPARDFGVIRFVYPSAEFQPSLNPQQAIDLAERELKDFDPTNDYLIFAGGDPVGLMICSVTLSRLFPSMTMFRTLRWERGAPSTDPDRLGMTGAYVPSTFFSNPQ